jgi:hypothetical protein
MQGLTYNDRLMISYAGGLDSGCQLSEKASMEGAVEGRIDHAAGVEGLGQCAGLDEEITGEGNAFAADSSFKRIGERVQR